MRCATPGRRPAAGLDPGGRQGAGAAGLQGRDRGGRRRLTDADPLSLLPSRAGELSRRAAGGGTGRARPAGHDVDLRDLYAEGSIRSCGRPGAPRLPRRPAQPAWASRPYRSAAQGRGADRPVPDLVLRPAGHAQGLPDRCLIPGSRSTSPTRPVRPILTHIGKLAGVVTYGRPRRAAWCMGDPPRKLVTRYLRWFVAPKAQVDFHALYGMNIATAATSARRSSPASSTRWRRSDADAGRPGAPGPGKLQPRPAGEPVVAALAAPATRSGRWTSTASASTRCCGPQERARLPCTRGRTPRRSRTSSATCAGPKG